MNKTVKLLVINPGSTSTKVAVFHDDRMLFEETIQHDASSLNQYNKINDQLDYRTALVLDVINRNKIDLEAIDAYVGRGGSACPMSGGVYAVSDLLLEHTRKGMLLQHPSNLGCQIARIFADRYDKPAFVVNPPCVDEFSDLARITGFKDIYRHSTVHALNQKACGERYAQSIGQNYSALNLIIAHIGGGISVAAHVKGKMVDANDAVNGDGPMAPTRSGSLPATDLVNLCYSGQWREDELYQRMTKNGGLTDHLGTSDLLEVSRRIEQGDRYARLVLDAMIYQIAKTAGAMAVVLRGQVDQIILTGGAANDPALIDQLTGYLDWIAPITVYPGAFEMEALASGAIRVLKGEEPAAVYSGEPVWRGFEQLKMPVD